MGTCIWLLFIFSAVCLLCSGVFHHIMDKRVESGLKFHVTSTNWSLCTSYIVVWHCALQWICWRRLVLALFSTRQPHTPLTAAKPSSFLLNTGNALMISFCKLSKTMKTTHIPLLLEVLFCWSRQFSPHLAMLSA